jgi:hypothetical protein
MWSVIVALPVVQSEFGIPRAEASLPLVIPALKSDCSQRCVAMRDSDSEANVMTE